MPLLIRSVPLGASLTAETAKVSVLGVGIGVLTAASRAGVVLNLEEDLAFSRAGQVATTA